MKKRQGFFLVQIGIAIIIFIGVSFFVKSIFYKDTKVSSYLSLNDDIITMANSTEALLDSLIIKNDVTFDPTSGKEIDKVFRNLKHSGKEKLLMIGSSQLRVIQGQDITRSYQKIISKKIDDYTNNTIQTYNLSLGGMTKNEKLIVANKAVEVINPDKILISVTPFDCLSDNIRNTVKVLENTDFQKPSENQNDRDVNPYASYAQFPLNINHQLMAFTDDIFEKNMAVYSKRTAIKKWLTDKMMGIRSSVMPKKDTQEIKKLRMPKNWYTVNQELNNITGWDDSIFRTGKKSVKIVNLNAKNAKWYGKKILLKKPSRTFRFEGWSRAEKVSDTTKLYCLDFQVIFEDGSEYWYYNNLKFNKGTHDWQQIADKVSFDKKVSAIKPHLLFYGGTGTVWFDDIKIIPFDEGVETENLVVNPGFEDESKERENVSYQYKEEEWDKIHENMIKIVDFLSQQKTLKNASPILLVTPFWHHNERSAYPQKAKYDELMLNVKTYCQTKDVSFIDASYILSKDHFGIYTKGNRKNKIDVLHFDEDGHNKLLNYMVKELGL